MTIPSPNIPTRPIDDSDGGATFIRKSQLFIGQAIRQLPVILIVGGVILRLLFSTSAPAASQLIGEANNVAISFAHTGALSDAFRVGQGPTAHVTPIAPIVAGAVYRQFGVNSTTSGILLSLWSLGLVAVAWTCLYRGFALLDMPRVVRLSALAFLTLIPLNPLLEAVQFRVWEGALGVALAYSLLYRVLLLDRQVAITTTQLALLALQAAITLIVSPPLGVAAFACGLILMLRKIQPRRWPAVIAVVFATTAVTLAPWTLRNIEVMHAPIVLRDNFGLELALAYYDGADAPGNPLVKFKARHNAIHPYQPKGNAAMLAAGGEVAYANALGKTATSYIVTHPAAFVRLSARHLTDFLFPPPWEWSQFGRTGTATLFKVAMNWLITIFGFIGLVYGWRRFGQRYAYIAAMALLPVMPYVFVQPTLRYHYLIVNLMVFIAAAPVVALVTRLSKEVNGSGLFRRYPGLRSSG